MENVCVTPVIQSKSHCLVPNTGASTVKSGFLPFTDRCHHLVGNRSNYSSDFHYTARFTGFTGVLRADLAGQIKIFIEVHQVKLKYSNTKTFSL